MIRIIPLLLFILSCASTPALADKFRDFSESSAEHKILKGILLDARNVDFVSKGPIEFYGKPIEASLFFIRTSQSVPFMPGTIQQSTVLKDIYGFYDLLVAEDNGGRVHDELIDSIHSSLQRADWNEFGFVRGSTSYLVFGGPAKSPELVWIGGKLVQARLRRFSEKRRDINADAESFWKDKIRFDLDGRRVRIESPKKSTQEQFLRSYQDGLFSAKKSS
jgi:hypothetical protein